MANNFFDLVKSSFFNPLANGYVTANYDLLMLINNKKTKHYENFQSYNSRDGILWYDNFRPGSGAEDL